ncbi:antitoxin VapB family protein [Candidatus Micrarchaeota archaeon]|nr:antitoxin VapB family protein [Candidatus Micrarchaeota archaeon]
MVKVITIMDDVYAELYSLKKSKGMSFTQAIRFLLKERREESRGLINLAGSIEDKDINRSAVEKIRREYNRVR